MRMTALSVGLVGFVGLAGLLVASPALAGVKAGDRAREVRTVRTEKGKKIRIRDYRGKVLVVTFGASWCPPCKKELHALEKVARRIRTAKHPVRFLAVNVDSTKAKGVAFMKQFNLECVLAGYDPQGTAKNTYNPPTMPSTYVIDKHGVVKWMHKGYRPGDEKAIAKKVMELVGK